ncbi:META domain-containing protein [Corynebacterium poyangense]|uniref:META domain-containing protein n=1 Tax=Corynebacterium poyangense TaxID=2684405 RepID=A0A7H0SR24_9CORY|nr:META domain-containing protein [Corynebacterium poyangense]QNQ90999.1 META domain-containing protein [Corynebacterium poyangense]
MTSLPRHLHLHHLGAAVIGVVLAASTSACSSQQSDASSPPGNLDNREWQVTNIYSSPSDPNGIPPTLAGKAFLVFGANTLTGSTGCSQIQATVQLSDTELELRNMELEPADGAPCTGRDLDFHNHMVDILHSGPLEILHLNASEIVVREKSDQPNPPAIRLLVPAQSTENEES